MASPSLSILITKLTSLGLALFPLEGKKPVQKGWRQAATTIPQIALAYFSNPNYNIGVATGAPSGGLVVVDFDDNEPEWNEWPETLTVKSPREGGGWHLYFRDVVQRQSCVGWKPGIDVRAEGGLVVGPGSVTSAGTYQIVRDAPIARLPDVGIPGYSDKPRRAVTVSTFSGSESTIVAELADGIIGTLAAMAEGSRNITLFKQSCFLSELIASGVLSSDRLREAVKAAIQAGMDSYEAERTVSSAWTTVTGQRR
jgi:hypothetical protein